MFHIIDDEEAILEFLSDLIDEMGFEARIFSCPLEYLAYVGSPEYTVPVAIISDVSMPKMDGFEMLESISGKYPEIRTAIISGYFENRLKAKKNACIFLHKPFDIELIKQTLEIFAICHENGPHPKEYECNAGSGAWECPHASHCKKTEE